jgi:copper homeostasis protein
MDRRDLLRGLVAAAAAIPAGSLSAKVPTRMVELEIIVSSVEDALAAHRGGATRMAIEASLIDGGLTPPQQLVEDILNNAPLPARVMLRLDVQSPSDFALRGKAQLDELKSRARALSSLKIEGLLTGYSRDGKLDLETLREIIDAAPTTHYTIHNVIEFTDDPLAALRSLSGFAQVDRAMVPCGTGTLAERMKRIPAYEAALGPQRLLVLGGLELDMLSTLRRETDIRSYHLGKAVRTPQNPSGKVDQSKVEMAHKLLFL